MRTYACTGGWMSVPFKNAAGQIVPRQYVYGCFVHGYDYEAYAAAAAIESLAFDIAMACATPALESWAAAGG